MRLAAGLSGHEIQPAALQPGLTDWIEQRLSFRGASVQALDDLVNTAPEGVLDWMRRKARLADGHLVGEPVGSLKLVDDLAMESHLEPTRLGDQGRPIKVAWVFRVAMCRLLASASWNEIGNQTGRPASSCASSFKRHHARLIDGHEPYRQAVARVGALNMEWRTRSLRASTDACGRVPPPARIPERSARPRPQRRVARGRQPSSTAHRPRRTPPGAASQSSNAPTRPTLRHPAAALQAWECLDLTRRLPQRPASLTGHPGSGVCLTCAAEERSCRAPTGHLPVVQHVDLLDRRLRMMGARLGTRTHGGATRNEPRSRP